jgi:outer membrane protein
VIRQWKGWFFAAAAGLALTAAATGAAQTTVDTLRLDVEEAVRHAMRDGLEAAIARQEVLAAQAGVGIARSYALPHLDAAATYTRNLKKPVIFFEIDPGEVQSFEIGQDNAWFGGLSLRQTLFASGRIHSGYNMAKDRARAAEWAGDDAAAVIAREVKTAYYIVLLAGAQTDIAEKSLEQAERNVAQITGRVRQGITADFDRLRAEVTVENRKPIVTRVRNDERIALESLKRALRIPLDYPVVLSDSLQHLPYVETLEEVMARALESRRDLAAARAEASAAEYQLKAQAAMLRPLLYFDANVSWLGETSEGMWPGERESASSAGVGLTFAWPIFDGFRNRNETRVARAQAHAAKLQENRVADFVRLDVRTSYSEVQTITQEIVGAERAVEVAREAYKIAQVRYGTGASRLIELLDSELALIEAALVLNETLYRYNVAVANLEYSTGEGPKLGLENGEEDR